MTTLSGYRLMWMLVMFDLPTLTKANQKAATKFRDYLLDEGFEMAQLSVYMRWCAGKEQVDALTRRIGIKVPKSGKVSIIGFTDRQYENIVSFYGKGIETPGGKPQQFELF